MGDGLGAAAQRGLMVLGVGGYGLWIFLYLCHCIIHRSSGALCATV